MYCQLVLCHLCSYMTSHHKKSELKEKCEQYGMKPRRNEIGNYGFVRYDVRKLHNQLYHECRGNGKDAWQEQEDDPWA